MKKVLVHLHLYYYNQLDYFLDKLRNIVDCNWDLYVTVIEYHQKDIDKILAFKPDTKIIEVTNKGYDVYPFIQVLRSVNINDYDYVLKLHTKNYCNFMLPHNNYYTFGFSWRDSLVSTLIGSKEIFKENLNAFDDETGIIVNKDFLLKFNSYAGILEEDSILLDNLKERLHITSDYQYFLAGTMFFAKANIFDKLINSDIKEDDFSTFSQSHTSCSLAHVLERIFCVLADDKSYKVLALPTKELPNKSSKKISIRNSVSGRYKIINIFGMELKYKIITSRKDAIRLSLNRHEISLTLLGKTLFKFK